MAVKSLPWYYFLMNNKKTHITLFAVSFLMLAMALVLNMEGRMFICACGSIKLWYSQVVSSENSQHLFDWYSFTHILHGLIFYFCLWLVDRRKKLSFQTKLIIATGIEAGWEIIENSSYVINLYRANTISLNYYGDTIINSLGDVFSMILGFIFSYLAKPKYSAALLIFIELALAFTIRDNLILNIIMLVHPVEFIKNWQAGL